MSVTRAQAMDNTREMMDARNSQRWSDAFVRTALGIASSGEWSGILKANPYFRFAQRSVTTDTDGQFAYTDLNSGSGDSAENWYRILSISDGNSFVYRQTAFMSVPLATTTNYQTTYDRLWYDAGDDVQILPVSASLALTVVVNHTPPRVDQLSADTIAIDFPDGHETILWLEAAAYLLSKGGAENDAAQTMRAMAQDARESMYADISRRAARPAFLQFSDSAEDWAAG